MAETDAAPYKAGDKFDIMDAVMFTEWLTPAEIAKKTDERVPAVKRFIKEWMELGYIEEYKGKYRYNNVDEEY